MKFLSLIFLITLSSCAGNTMPEDYACHDTQALKQTAVNHDPEAFTQGLVIEGDHFLESTGLYGRSSLRRVEKASGKVLQKHDLPSDLFGEGLTVLGGRIYQLTYKEGVCLIYDINSFEKLGEVRYSGEGWGMTDDEKHLITTDGTSTVKFRRAEDLEVVREVKVFDEVGKEVHNLNELEYAPPDTLYANVWQTPDVIKIDLKSGKVVARKSFHDLAKEHGKGDQEAVLNGIAFDKTSNKLYLTGKLWDKIYALDAF